MVVSPVGWGLDPRGWSRVVGAEDDEWDRTLRNFAQALASRRQESMAGQVRVDNSWRSWRDLMVHNSCEVICLVFSDDKWLRMVMYYSGCWVVIDVTHFAANLFDLGGRNWPCST